MSKIDEQKRSGLAWTLIRTMEDDDDEEYFEPFVYGQRETNQDATTECSLGSLKMGVHRTYAK